MPNANKGSLKRARIPITTSWTSQCWLGVSGIFFSTTSGRKRTPGSRCSRWLWRCPRGWGVGTRWAPAGRWSSRPASESRWATWWGELLQHQHEEEAEARLHHHRCLWPGTEGPPPGWMALSGIPGFSQVLVKQRTLQFLKSCWKLMQARRSYSLLSNTCSCLPQCFLLCWRGSIDGSRDGLACLCGRVVAAYSDVYFWKPQPARQQSWQVESPQSCEPTIFPILMSDPSHAIIVQYYSQKVQLIFVKINIKNMHLHKHQWRCGVPN